MGELKDLFVAKIHTFHPVPPLIAVAIGAWTVVPPLALGDTATPSMADRIQEQIQAGLDKARAEFAAINPPAPAPAGSPGVTVVVPNTTGSASASQPAAATTPVVAGGAVAGVAAGGGDSGGGGGGGGGTGSAKSSRTAGTQLQGQPSAATQTPRTGSAAPGQGHVDLRPAGKPPASSAPGPLEIHPAPHFAPEPPVVVQPAPPPVVVVRPPPPPFAFVGPFIAGVLRAPAPGRAPAPVRGRGR
jgi:hypothetical protein